MKHRWDLLNALIKKCDYMNYLEIGAWLFECAAEVRAVTRTVVDPAPRCEPPDGIYFWHMTSDEFFRLGRRERGQYELIFIDGLHHAPQVLRDVENALKILAPGGTIVLHDCNPRSERAQRFPRPMNPRERFWNGDCWRAMVELRCRDGLKAGTVDMDEGMGIVRPSAAAKAPLSLEPLPGEPMSYDTFVARKEELLGLVPASEWESLL